MPLLSLAPLCDGVFRHKGEIERRGRKFKREKERERAREKREKEKRGREREREGEEKGKERGKWRRMKKYTSFSPYSCVSMRGANLSSRQKFL